MKRTLKTTVLALHGVAVTACLLAVAGCRSAGDHRQAADRAAARSIDAAQARALGRTEPITIESPAETLRRRLLLDQQLAYKAPASLGVHDLPDTEYWDGAEHLAGSTTNALPPGTERQLTFDLLGVLQVGARNSRDFRDAKEDLYQAALALDLESDDFRNTFAGMLTGSYEYTGGEDASTETARGSGEIGWTRNLLTGVQLSSSIAVDLVKLLTLEASSSLGILADAGISVPLLRGAGRKVAGESLKQAEQDLLYAVYAFERFKRVFAVRVATEDLSVLEQRQQIRNAEENYKRLIAASRRSRRQADAGRLPEFQFDQAVQDELRARSRWISAQQNYAARLDGLKVLIGLPPDADIALDPADLERLDAIIERLNPGDVSRAYTGPVPPADAPIVLKGASRDSAGPLEMDVETAGRLALDRRLDLRSAEGRVEDAQRRVYVAADALRAEITLLGRAQVGARRTSAAAAGQDNANLRPNEGDYSALLTLDLPFERTAERIAYRNSLIALEQAVRAFQRLEDEIKLGIRNTLRDLLEAREGFLIQVQAVALAEKRVHSTDLFLQAGEAQVRDVLESQEALLNAQNALTSALVNYRVAEWVMQRDLGLLEVTQDGLWKEYRPE